MGFLICSIFYAVLLGYMEPLNLDLQNEVKVRCPNCRRTLSWINEETLGFIQIVCPHTDCKTKTDYLLFSGNAYVINGKLLKRKHIMDRLPLEFKKRIISILDN